MFKSMFVIACACIVVFSAGCRSAAKKPIVGGGDDIVVIPQNGTPQNPEDFETLSKIDGVKMEVVYFDYDKYAINSSEMSKIEAAAAFMKKTPEARLICAGNCDERGSSEYNVALGDNRAQAVRSHLISLGVNADTVKTKSFGEDNPADPGHDESAWKQNRRVEFDLRKVR